MVTEVVIDIRVRDVAVRPRRRGGSSRFGQIKRGAVRCWLDQSCGARLQSEKAAQRGCNRVHEWEQRAGLSRLQAEGHSERSRTAGTAPSGNFHFRSWIGIFEEGGSPVIARKPSDVEVSDEVRREADRHGPIVTRDGYTVLDTAAWEGLLETLRILSNPAEAADLRAAIADLDAGRYVERQTKG